MSGETKEFEDAIVKRLENDRKSIENTPKKLFKVSETTIQSFEEYVDKQYHRRLDEPERAAKNIKYALDNIKRAPWAKGDKNIMETLEKLKPRTMAAFRWIESGAPKVSLPV